MGLDLAGGRRLLLAGGGAGWFWLAAGSVALVLLLVLYREERRLVSRRAGLGLLGLRVLAALVLVLALFEPIAARTYRETVKGRVLLAVDVSESMATPDANRSAEDARRLAEALRLSPGTALAAMPRREVARRLIDGPDAPLAPVARDHTIEALAFARDAATGPLGTIAEALKTPSRPDDPASLVTDWLPTLAEALKESSSSAPVLGVVLVTDGRRNAPGDPAPLIDRLSARGVPIYPVLVGATVPPRDAAVAALKAPEGVYKGDVATVEATLKLDGYAGREIVVTLERPGASPLRQTVQAPEGGARPTVSFRVPMDETGTVPLTVAVAPQEGDVRPDNDKRSVSVQVADDKAKVLLVEDEARWEFRYLRNALTRDPRVTIETVVFRQPVPASGSTEDYTYPRALPEQPVAATGMPDPLGGFDAIVIGDVDPAHVSAEVWTRLESYVSERGGTLVISPGPRFWPGLQGANETARKLLPVLDPVLVAVDPQATDPAHPSLPPGVSLVPTPSAFADAGAWPMLQFASEPEQNRAVWSGLPWLPWLLAGKAKPGASVLAAARDESAAVIAAQPYGLGKVLWLGTDGTWRWRYRIGDAYHHRFWGQVVRWAASGKLSAGNAYVRFGPVRPRVAAGEGVKIQARISEGVPGVTPDLLIAARIGRSGAKPGEDAVAVTPPPPPPPPPRPVAGQPRTFEGTAPCCHSAVMSSGSTCPSSPAPCGSTRGARHPKRAWK